MSTNEFISLSKYANMVKQESVKSQKEVYLETMIKRIKNTSSPTSAINLRSFGNNSTKGQTK